MPRYTQSGHTVAVSDPAARWTPLSAGLAGCVIAGICGLLAWRHGWTGSTLIGSGFTVTAVPLAVIDAWTRRVPNLLVALSGVLVVGASIVVVLASDGAATRMLYGLAGAAVLGLFHLALYAAFPGQFGGGDVKIAIPVGFTLAWLGWATLVAGVLLGWLLAAAYAVVDRAVRAERRAPGLPLAPFLISGALVAALV